MQSGQAMRVLTRSQCRELDRQAAERYAMPPDILMENAARGVAEEVLARAGARGAPRVLVACGPGQNGGDGLAAARHLHNAGADVQVIVALGDAYTSAARTNREIIARMGVACEVASGDPAGLIERLARAPGPDLAVLDALFGTGLSRALEGPALSAVRAVNRLGSAGARVIAIDCPSGLNADTGQPMPEAVRAAVTVTFAALKPGYLTLEAQAYVGEVVVADIGVPRELVASLGRPVTVAFPPEPRSMGGGEEEREPPSGRARGRT
jgi:hydroxyethylthiazole kinase-like uncharacterized protein yjeF